MSVSIILAAGEGTRMKSKIPKVLHKVCGRSILEYVVSASKDAGIEKNIVIVGHGADKVKESFEGSDIYFENQPIGENAPYGTGYAVKQGIEHINDNDDVVILCGDTPLITGETIKKLMKFHKDEKYMGTVLTAVLEDSTGYGRIVRDDSKNIEKIVEEKDACDKVKKIKEINTGVYVFNGKLLKDALEEIDNNNAQGEFYITDVVGILKAKGYNIGAFIIDDSKEIYGINSRVQLSICESIMQKRINRYHMSQGVTLINPENIYIHDTVKIGQDTIIHSGVTLEGNTVIGEDCLIRTGTRINNSVISDSVSIESSLIEESEVGKNTTIGPNAHLRPNCKIGESVRLGNFVEVKNSNLGDGTKAGHLAYIGDADVGSNVNVGCGVIFVNYNGKGKDRTIIGDNVFIGSNSNLVAPVTINNWAYIAAGSTIIEDVDEGELSIARSYQVNKSGWVERKGLKKK